MFNLISRLRSKFKSAPSTSLRIAKKLLHPPSCTLDAVKVFKVP